MSNLAQSCFWNCGNNNAYSAQWRKWFKLIFSCLLPSNEEQFKSPKTLRYISNDSRLNQEVHLTSHLLDNKMKIMYCWNHKVASSFWMWMFSKIHTGREPQPGKPTWMIQNKISPKHLSTYKRVVSTYQNILLIRHPMVRLVSAYRDRIYGLKATYTTYKRIAEALNLDRIDTKLKFSVKRGIKGKLQTINYSKPIAVPTFPEFVQYLLSTNTEKDVRKIHIY